MSLQSLLLLALVGVTSVYASLHPTECGSLQRLMVGNWRWLKRCVDSSSDASVAFAENIHRKYCALHERYD